MPDPVDRRLAAAEARLDRLDAAAEEPASDGHADLDLSDGMHIEDSGEELEVAPAAVGLSTEEILLELDRAPDPELADCADTFAEAFNARDLDRLLEVVTPDGETPGLGNDLDHFPEAIEDLWGRRPTSLLTRGELDDRCVGVLWEFAEEGGWWRVAVVHFDDCRDGQMGVIEFSDDAGILDEVQTVGPDGDLDEGSRWEEWSDGALTEP